MPTMSKDYNTEYYRLHREELLEARRKRYVDDEEYRKKIHEARERYKSKIKNKRGEYVLKAYKTKTIRVLKIGTVMQKLGVTRAVLITWENIGLLPPALPLLGISRYYTDTQFRLISEMVDLYNLGVPNSEIKSKLADKAHAHWKQGL